MKKICIQTLTHDYELAGHYLKLVVDKFFENTDIPDSLKVTNGKIDWYIRLNGTNENLNQTITYITDTYAHLVNWHIFEGTNMGVGAGINFLNNQTTDYEFTLFIEGDWVCMDGVNKNWLSSALELLTEHADVDLVFLRRYISDTEDRQNGMSDWINKDSVTDKVVHNDIEFILLERGFYTNNPTIRRQHSLFNKNIFPLNEYYDESGNPTEIKGFDDWGRAEIEANRCYLKTLYLWPGVFIHENRYNGVPTIPCEVCKYGFLETSNWFCLSCSMNDEFYNLREHTGRGIETLLDPIHHEQMDLTNLPQITEFVASVVDVPTVDIMELVKKYYG